MEEEASHEEIAAIVGALSAIDLQLQEVERTARERAEIFCEEAEQSESPTSIQFNTGGHMLREIRSEVREVREYIDCLKEFMRTGTSVKARSGGIPKRKTLAQPGRTRSALRDAAVSFKKASNALHVVGRALETEDLEIYADHLFNLSESVEAEAKRARSALKEEQ